MSPRVRGLEHVSPNDADFMIAQESNAPVYPPSLEEKVELRESRKACKESYDKAEDEGDIAAAQLLSTACDVLDDRLIAKQESFDLVKKCIDMAAAAERMELGVKPVNMTKAGQWKLLSIKLQSRLQPFEAATAATAAAAATALADSRKRRHAAIADATAVTAAAGGVEELDLVRFFCRYLCTLVSHLGTDALHFFVFVVVFNNRASASRAAQDGAEAMGDELAAAAHPSARERKAKTYERKSTDPKKDRKKKVTRTQFDAKIAKRYMTAC
jgi:hypothetical protein